VVVVVRLTISDGISSNGSVSDIGIDSGLFLTLYIYVSSIHVYIYTYLYIWTGLDWTMVQLYIYTFL